MNAPLKKLNELAAASFDGVRSGYVPPKKLSIAKKLRLHRKWGRDIDPVTFEVVRHALWNVNEEHGATIQRRRIRIPMSSVGAAIALNQVEMHVDHLLRITSAKASIEANSHLRFAALLTAKTRDRILGPVVRHD